MSLLVVDLQRRALQRGGAERGVQAHMHEPDALGLDPGGFAQQRAQTPLAPRGVFADAAQAAEREQFGEVLVGVGEDVLDQRLLGRGEHADLDQPPPRLEQVVPAQQAGAPLGEVARRRG